MKNNKLIVIIFTPLCLHAQERNDSILKKRVFGLVFQKGATLIHKPSVASIKDATPLAIGVEFSTQQLGYTSYSICRTYLRNGISLSYINFNNSVIGKGVTGTVFLQPVYRIGKKFQFQFRGDIGLGYFTRPYNEVDNKTNKSYSTHLTPYLHVSSGVGFRINKKIIAEVNGHFNHISNGHFKQPNAGLNWLMLSGSLLYYPENIEFPKYKYVRTRRERSGLLVDLGIMFTPRQGYHNLWDAKRNYMVGINSQVAAAISRINALTAGIEVSYSNYKNGAAAPADNSRPGTTVAFNIGNEFLLGKTIFSQQLGIYISRYPSFHSGIYHRWGLRYMLNKHSSVGFSMKAHREIADLIDFRYQYRF